MTPRELEQQEYQALRDTIRQRGTARVWVFLAGLVAWGALTLATAVLASLPIAALLPLLVLAATFEAVFSLHVGVERIGRYIQVFFEESNGRGWEHTAMAFGDVARGTRGIRTDPLFAAVFWLATLMNFIPVLLAEPVRLEVVVVGTAHIVVILRILVARRAAAGQRASDLARFTELRGTRAKS